MHTGTTCPRCSRRLNQPADFAGAWTCDTHGVVAPLQPPLPASHYAVRTAAISSQVPLWMPWPLPNGWMLNGLRLAGDELTGATAAVVSLSGPDPLPEANALAEAGFGEADLLFIAEQPAVGLGPHLAGLEDLDPGQMLLETSSYKAADIKLNAMGHDVPLWSIPTTNGSAAYVGEAAGVWLWILAWPAHAAAMLLEGFALMDLRDPGLQLDLPYGPPTVRLGRPPE